MSRSEDIYVTLFHAVYIFLLHEPSLTPANCWGGAIIPISYLEKLGFWKAL